ncbi:5207_t:CDS:1, partial [Racocetra fulgida]
MDASVSATIDALVLATIDVSVTAAMDAAATTTTNIVTSHIGTTIVAILVTNKPAIGYKAQDLIGQIIALLQE